MVHRGGKVEKKKKHRRENAFVALFDQSCRSWSWASFFNGIWGGERVWDEVAAWERRSRGRWITGRTQKISGVEGKLNDCIWRFSPLPVTRAAKVLVYGNILTCNCLFLGGRWPDDRHVDRKPKYTVRITIRARNNGENSEKSYCNNVNWST